MVSFDCNNDNKSDEFALWRLGSFTNIWRGDDAWVASKINGTKVEDEEEKK